MFVGLGLVLLVSPLIASSQQPVTEYVGPACRVFEMNLRYGLTDADAFSSVSDLQQILIDQGYLNIEAPTGYFGRLTFRAVKVLQADNDIPNTGFVGILTRGFLNSLPCRGGNTTTFSASPSSGPAPLAVNFSYSTKSLSGDANNYSIEFGDGQSTVPKVNCFDGVTVWRCDFSAEHIYSSAGTYTAKLIYQPPYVCNPLPGGACATIAPAPKVIGTVTITVAGQTANFSAIPTSGPAPLSVHLSYSGTVPVPVPVGTKYTLDYGDSSSENITTACPAAPGTYTKCGLRSTNYTYIRSGSYTVTLTQTIDGCVGWTDQYHPCTSPFEQKILGSAMITVSGNSNNLTATPTSGPAPLKVAFKAYPQSCGGGDFDLIYGDGSSEEIVIPADSCGYIVSRSHTYALPYVAGLPYEAKLAYRERPCGAECPAPRPPIGTVKITVTGSSTSGPLSVSSAKEVPAQNISAGAKNQPLGGFAVEAQGEGIVLQKQIFHINYSSSDAAKYPLTNVILVDEKGAVVAGPVDAIVSGAEEQKVTFTDAVVYPIGRHVFSLKGKIPAEVRNNETLQSWTTPAQDWSGATGQTTGNSIALAALNSAVVGNKMTIKKGAFTILLSSTPGAQNVVAGTANFTSANIVLDASNSGEDIRVPGIDLLYTDNMPVDITNCQIFDGVNVLGTGSLTVNPRNESSDKQIYRFSFDAPLTLARGTVKTVSVKCAIPASAASGSFSWGLFSANYFAGIGVISGEQINPAITTNYGNTMTVAQGGAGSLWVTTDPSSPAYSLAVAGTSGVTLGAFRFSAKGEDVRLDRVGISLADSAYSGDITQLTLWDGGSLVATAVITGSKLIAISTAFSNFTIPRDSSRLLTIKGDLAAIGVGQPGRAGDLVRVNITSDTYGIGVSSGSSIQLGSSGEQSAGVRVFRTVPTVARITPSSSTLIAQVGFTLYQFSIKADAANDLSIYQVTPVIGVSSPSSANGSVSVSNLKIYAYTDSSFSSGVPGFTDGQVAAISTVSNGRNAVVLSSPLTIPKGQTYYFNIRADVTQTPGNAGSSGSVTTNLAGDTSYAADTATQISSSSFVWSPNDLNMSAPSDRDWTNGFGVSGLPSGGTDSFTLTK